MGAVGGDIKELSFTHPTIGQVTLYPKANEDSTLDLGGFRTEDDDNGVDGSGAVLKKITQSRWSAEMTVAGAFNTRNDLDKLNQLSGDPVDATWTITHVSGAVFKCVGSPVGDVKENLNDATIKLKIAGGGQVKKIAG